MSRPDQAASVTPGFRRWLSATPGLIDVLELAQIEGQEGPYTETRPNWDSDGIEVKCRLDAGAKAIDYRGLYRSSGV